MVLMYFLARLQRECQKSQCHHQVNEPLFSVSVKHHKNNIDFIYIYIHIYIFNFGWVFDDHEFINVFNVECRYFKGLICIIKQLFPIDYLRVSRDPYVNFHPPLSMASIFLVSSYFFHLYNIIDIFGVHSDFCIWIISGFKIHTKKFFLYAQQFI